MGYRRFRDVFLLVLWLFLPTLAGNELVLEGFSDREGVPQLRFSVPSRTTKVELFRSTSNLDRYSDPIRFPIVCYRLSKGQNSYRDLSAPHGVRLYYQLKAYFPDRPPLTTGAVAVETPLPAPQLLLHPYMVVDKLNYTLSLMDGKVCVRRFPVALGQNPTNRKLHQDRASTPEGLYRITGLQPRATYYRAFDINYPNRVDQERYNLFSRLGLLPRPRPHIGGEIQIHGEGIAENWTWGCIALRNRDIDWLFAQPKLYNEIEVLIAGSDLSVEDLKSIWSTSYSEQLKVSSELKKLGISEGSFHQTLGRYQHESGLTITGELDLRTRRLLNQDLQLGTH